MKYIYFIELTKQGGCAFFTDSFMAYGNAKAESKSLQRLVKAGEIEKVATGIYVRPIVDTFFGKVSTSVENIAKAIAMCDRARIVPRGVYALNRFGLSTQVPLNVVFLTDVAARKIQIGITRITFEKTTAKNVAAVAEMSRLAIQALRSIRKEKVTADENKNTKGAGQRKEKLAVTGYATCTSLNKGNNETSTQYSAR